MSRNYRYGDESTAETEYYLAKITGQAQANAASRLINVDQVAQSESNSEKKVEAPESRVSRLARIFLVGMCFALLSVGAIGVALLFTDEKYLKIIWPLGFYGGLALAALLALASLIGLVGGLWRVDILGRLFAFLVVIFILGCAVAIVLATEAGSGRLGLSDRWNAAVKNSNDVSALCKFEKRFNCAGWEQPCHPYSANSVSCPNCTDVPGTALQTTCKDAFHTAIKTHLPIVVCVIGGCLILGCIALLLIFRSRRVYLPPMQPLM